MRTEAEDDDDDSPRLARLLVWKVAEATEPGLLIGAAELSSDLKRAPLGGTTDDFLRLLPLNRLAETVEVLEAVVAAVPIGGCAAGTVTLPGVMSPHN